VYLKTQRPRSFCVTPCACSYLAGMQWQERNFIFCFSPPPPCCPEKSFLSDVFLPSLCSGLAEDDQTRTICILFCVTISRFFGPLLLEIFEMCPPPVSAALESTSGWEKEKQQEGGKPTRWHPGWWRLDEYLDIGRFRGI
jgi:hypothetical protein